MRTPFLRLLPLLILSAILLAACSQQKTPTALPTPLQSTQALTPTPPPLEPTPAPTETPTELPAAPEATPTEPAPTPSPTQPPADNPAGSTCINKAGYFGDVTIPDDTSFKQNTPFTKTWKVRNEGDCVWEGYKLVYAGGETFDGPFANPIPLIQPGEVKDISVEMVSPPQGGLFTSFWELESADGTRFGFNASGKDLIWVRISVSWYPDGGGGPHLPVVAGCSPEAKPDFEAQLLALINAARAENGLPALTINEKLTAAARGHSTDMACFGIRDHTGSNGSNIRQRVEAQGLVPAYVSENIYYGHPEYGGDVAGTFDWWMNSTVHRNNILSAKATQIGIGHVYLASGDGWGYSTLNFARP